MHGGQRARIKLHRNCFRNFCHDCARLAYNRAKRGFASVSRVGKIDSCNKIVACGKLNTNFRCWKQEKLVGSTKLKRVENETNYTKPIWKLDRKLIYVTKWKTAEKLNRLFSYRNWKESIRVTKLESTKDRSFVIGSGKNWCSCSCFRTPRNKFLGRLISRGVRKF